MPTKAVGAANAMPPEPWCSFLYDLDSQLKDVVALRCLGGFVVTQQYGIGRGTSDIGACANMGISMLGTEHLFGNALVEELLANRQSSEYCEALLQGQQTDERPICG